jgi:hypothetical protein
MRSLIKLVAKAARKDPLYQAAAQLLARPELAPDHRARARLAGIHNTSPETWEGVHRLSMKNASPITPKSAAAGPDDAGARMGGRNPRERELKITLKYWRTSKQREELTLTFTGMM